MSEKEYIFVGTAQLKTRDYIKWLEKENRELKNKHNKALKYIDELLSDVKGIIRDYSYYKEHNKIMIELLREDEQIYIKLLEILGDKENE